MSVKIQINSLEALERLIGDDKNLEIQVKESILNGFAKNYLKSVTNSFIVEKLKTSILEELGKTNFFGMMKKDDSGFRPIYSLTYDFREKVEREVIKLVDEKIQSALQKPINDIYKQIERRFDILSSETAEVLSDENAKAHLDKLVQKKLESVLGLNK